MDMTKACRFMGNLRMPIETVLSIRSVLQACQSFEEPSLCVETPPVGERLQRRLLPLAQLLRLGVHRRSIWWGHARANAQQVVGFFSAEDDGQTTISTNT